MGKPRFGLGAVVMALAALAACQREPATLPAPPAPVPAESGSAPAPAAAPNPAVRQVVPEAAPREGIATQPGPNGSEVTLRSVRVTGNLVNVELVYQAAPDRALSTLVKLADVSLIDDATTQRYEVVKDASGRYMAQPLSGNGQSLGVNAGSGDTVQVSVRFAAPPASSGTVSISIPEVGSFDGVPVQR